MIQKQEFSNGDFVLHKVMINGSKYSAWYRADGTMHDCELILGIGKTRTVSLGHDHIRKELAIIGRRYTTKPAYTWANLQPWLPMLLDRPTAETLCYLAKLDSEKIKEHLDNIDKHHFDGQWYDASNLLAWIDEHSQG